MTMNVSKEMIEATIPNGPHPFAMLIGRLYGLTQGRKLAQQQIDSLLQIGLFANVAHYQALNQNAIEL
jgi:hypothetical protein